jgi:Lhr-like helicase
MSTICTILAMVAQHDWEIHQVDIKSAYLYADLKEEVYMRVLPGYLKAGEEGKILKLRKSLPGLNQASYEWHEELAAIFTKMGFMHSQANQAVFYKCTPQEHTVITVSVDDCYELGWVLTTKAQKRTVKG